MNEPRGRCLGSQHACRLGHFLYSDRSESNGGQKRNVGETMLCDRGAFPILSVAGKASSCPGLDGELRFWSASFPMTSAYGPLPYLRVVGREASLPKETHAPCRSNRRCRSKRCGGSLVQLQSLCPTRLTRAHVSWHARSCKSRRRRRGGFLTRKKQDRAFPWFRMGAAIPILLHNWRANMA